MTLSLRSLSIAFLFAVTAAWSTRLESRNNPAAGPAEIPKLVNTCLITSDVKRLVQFYEPVLGLKANKSGERYAEFPTGVGVLAIFSAEAQEKYIPHSAEAATNKSAILEFRVADVDQEYARLQSLVQTWVKPPTNQVWGTRSIYFRDPTATL